MPIKIHITDNHNEVLLTYIEGDDISVELIMSMLEEEHVIYGIKSQVINDLCLKKNTVYDLLIAEGMEKVDGIDGCVTYNFSTVYQAAPHIMEDGHVDYKDTDYIHSVSQDDIVASKTPATFGQDGMNVFGEELYAKDGFNPPLLAGENCVLDEEELNIIAEESGLVKLDKGKVCISKLFELHGDVGVETGNIEFSGQVVIHGNVTTGFSVSCDEDLTIDGLVEAADIYTDGDLLISKGIQGHTTAKIVCKGNMTVGYINSADIEVNGDLEVGSLTSANVICDGKIKVVGSKGMIIGGLIQTNFLEVNAIGTDLGVLTSIHLGMNSKEINELKTLSIQLIEVNKELKKLTQLIELLEAKLNISGETQENIDLLKKCKVTYTEQMNIMKNDEKRILKLKSLIRARKGVLSAGKISPDTRVMIGDQNLSITDSIDNCIITLENGKISVRSK